MADDIKVVADFTDLQLLRRELVGVSKDAQKSAAVFEREFNKVERQLKANATASQKYYAETLKLNKTAKDAAKSASVFEKELARQEARVESLAMKYKPLYASSKQYERALEEINEAHKLNVLSTQQHEAAVEQLNKEYTAFISGKAGWENQFVTGSSRAGKSLNRFGMYAQQVGYQVGDFFVQVQSGTNVFVAFGQQATQLAGLLPGVAGAIVGIGIAVGTTLLAMWDRSRQAASGIKEFEESLKNARKASKDLQAENERLARGFEDLSQAAFAQAVEMAYAKVLEAESKLAAVQNTTNQRTKKNAKDKVAYAQAELDIANAELDSLRERLKLNEQLRNMQDQNIAFTDALAESTEKARSKAQAYVENVAKLEEELGAAAVDALALAGIDLASGVDEAAKAAAELAANLGISFGLAQKLVAISAMGPEQSKFNAKISAGLIPPQAAGDFGVKGGETPYSLQKYMNEIDARVKAREEAARKAGKDGGAPKEDFSSYMASLEEELKLKNRLVGMTNEQATSAQRYFDIEQKALEVIARKEGKTRELTAVEEERIQKLVEGEAALRRVTEAEQKRKSMMETIEGHIENAFMAMIDGSSSVEDAFKGMLRNILLEIYRQQIAKPMASGIMKILGFSANGDVVNNGSYVKAFANGGVVSGATAFPMRGGVGVMGEAGPEAIMPLKRGPNGKLGVEASGGQQVVVNQSFNFAANGDESVKKIIAQAAPQIAQMTQKQIMDSRRRGGQMKAAFS